MRTYTNTNRIIATGLASGLAVFAAASASIAAGEIITVTTLEDAVDVTSPQDPADLPGPDGVVSFREALAVANNMAGPQTIEFAIPQNEWWLLTDRALLRLEDGPFVVTDDETTIDFTSQTDFTGDTNPNGWEVGMYGLQANGWGAPAIYITADNCVVKGLDRVMQRGQAVSISGSNNRVINCTITGPLHSGVEIAGPFGGPPATGNIIGGIGPNEGNTLSGGGSGVRIEAPAEDNIVIGNHISGGVVGVDVIGSIYTPSPKNNRIGGPTEAERNIIAGAGSYCCEGAPSGAQVSVDHAEGTIVENNWIGLTPDGTAGEGQLGPHGVEVRHSTGSTIRNNVIADIVAIGTNHFAGQVFGSGITIGDDCTGNVIEGNLIGTDATGVNPIPNHRGITVQSVLSGEPPLNNTIGGPDAGQGNTIAYSDLQGIRISGNAAGTTIRGNNVYANGLLGIDLGGDGVTANDNGDNDSGPNALQNFPVLSSAGATANTLTVQGSFNSMPNRAYTIDFFANGSCDQTGNGEGERFLGSISISTDANGDAAIDESISASIEAGEAITATATDTTTGNTSEFSNCLAVDSPTMIGDINNSGAVDVFDLLDLLSAWGACSGDCPADLTGDDMVNVCDLLALLANWS